MLLKILVCCFVQLLFIISVEGVSMSVTPSSMVIGSSSANPMTRLELRCSSDGTINTGIYSLEISRRRFTETGYRGIAIQDLIDGTKQDPDIPADILTKSPNITGSLSGTSGILTVTMNGESLTCNDQAEFKCEMSFKTAGLPGTQIVSASNNFTVITAPNDVRITDALYEDKGIQLQLSNDSKLNVGTKITYRCTANIGGDSNVQIMWERSSLMGPSSDFMTFTPTVPTDIVQDPVTQASCSYTRTSSMYYNMTSLDDDGITFRCKVRAYVGTQWYEPTSMHRRTFATSSGVTAKTGTSTGSTSEAGVIAGAVIGSIAGVVLIIVLIYFLCYRRRSSGESYRTKEEGERPEPPPTDYTYSMPDKKKNDGYDNKGLDDPNEKTTRFPRSGRGGFDGREGRNDRGHHNSGMEDEDGGTMHMSAGPIGTGV